MLKIEKIRDEERKINTYRLEFVNVLFWLYDYSDCKDGYYNNMKFRVFAEDKNTREKYFINEWYKE
jgi:hypothetical protein